MNAQLDAWRERLLAAYEASDLTLAAVAEAVSAEWNRETVRRTLAGETQNESILRDRLARIEEVLCPVIPQIADDRAPTVDGGPPLSQLIAELVDAGYGEPLRRVLVRFAALSRPHRMAVLRLLGAMGEEVNR